MGDAMAAAKCIDDLKEAGLSYDQARILVEFIVRSQEHLATKEDIKALRIRVDGLDAKIDSLAVEMKAEMKALEAKFTRQLYVFGFGIIGTMIAMLGLFLALLLQLQMPAG